MASATPDLGEVWAGHLWRGPAAVHHGFMKRMAGDSHGGQCRIGCSMADSIRRLFDGVRAARGQDPGRSRTARLIQGGPRKIAKKVAEEAAEVALESAAGNRDEVIHESADLIYHLVVLWSEAGVEPREVWAEMDRREKLYGIAEKIAKEPMPPLTKVRASPLVLSRPRRRSSR